MSVRVLIPALGAILTAAAALADVLPPNARWVSHRVRFENLNDFPDYVFFLGAEGFGPPDQPRKLVVRQLNANGEASMNHNPMEGNWSLYAVPRSLHDDPAAEPPQEVFQADGVLKSSALVGQIRTAPLGEKRDTFWVAYRVGIDERGKLQLSPVRHDVPDAPSAPEAGVPEGDSRRWFYAAGFGALAVLLVLWLLIGKGSKGAVAGP